MQCPHCLLSVQERCRRGRYACRGVAEGVAQKGIYAEGVAEEGLHAGRVTEEGMHAREGVRAIIPK